MFCKVIYIDSLEEYATGDCPPPHQFRLVREVRRLRAEVSKFAGRCLGDGPDETLMENTKLRKEVERLLSYSDGNDKDQEIADLEDEIRRLREELAGERQFCICGCPMDKHENYGEDGFSCDNPNHECVLVCAAAAEIVDRLREENERIVASYEKDAKTLCRCLKENSNLVLRYGRARELLERWYEIVTSSGYASFSFMPEITNETRALLAGKDKALRELDEEEK